MKAQVIDYQAFQSKFVAVATSFLILVAYAVFMM